MNHAQQYSQLIARALTRQYSNPLKKPYHLHHILPRSEGGTDHPGNLVQLTIKEHLLAHTLLAFIYPNQWLAVEILSQQQQLELPKWKRRQIAYQRAKNTRAANRARALAKFKQAESTANKLYIDTLLTACGAGPL